MRHLSEANLTNAVQMYAIANTPLFLIRKLREDSAVSEIALSFDGEVILEELRNVLRHDPQTAEDYARPYVYVVALAQKPEDRFLRQAFSLAGRQKWDWYEYVTGALLEMYMATKIQAVNPRGTAQDYTPVVAGTDAQTLVTIP